MTMRKLISFDFLKNEEIKDEFSAKGLKEAKAKLDVMKLPEKERRAYQRYLDELSYQASMVQSSYGIGRIKGREEGRQEGRQEGKRLGANEARLAMARALKKKGIAAEIIAEASRLSPAEIENL